VIHNLSGLLEGVDEAGGVSQNSVLEPISRGLNLVSDLVKDNILLILLSADSVPLAASRVDLHLLELLNLLEKRLAKNRLCATVLLPAPWTDVLLERVHPGVNWRLHGVRDL